MTKIEIDKIVTIYNNLLKITPTNDYKRKFIAYSKDFCRKAIDNNGVLLCLTKQL